MSNQSPPPVRQRQHIAARLSVLTSPYLCAQALGADGAAIDVVLDSDRPEEAAVLLIVRTMRQQDAATRVQALHRGRAVRSKLAEQSADVPFEVALRAELKSLKLGELRRRARVRERAPPPQHDNIAFRVLFRTHRHRYDLASAPSSVPKGTWRRTRSDQRCSGQQHAPGEHGRADCHRCTTASGTCRVGHACAGVAPRSSRAKARISHGVQAGRKASCQCRA